ncbi:MAG: MFS transporter, partial [Armatimonadota bacterium]
DANYRRLMRVRICLSAAGAIVPFFIAFAVDVWGFKDAIAATFITVQILSQMGGSFLSGWISDRLGNRKLLVVSGITLLATSVFAAVGTYLTPAGGVTVFGHLITWRLLVMMACFVGSGVFMSQLFPAYTNYLIDIAPRRKLPSYIGFGSGFTVPIAAAPMVFGWVSTSYGYRPIFVIASVLSVVGLYLSRQMGEPRDGIVGDDEQVAQEAKEDSD